jgi:hypothetical protein
MIVMMNSQPVVGFIAIVEPVHIQPSASEFWGKEIHQTWACIPKEYFKGVNV